jgi:ADP-ribose pyrophosphatase YjhB (NUDIX family)
MTTYRNPVPVSVALIPLMLPGNDLGSLSQLVGLACVQRGIPPQEGKLAMPGGWMEEGETAEQACQRETREEMDLLVHHACLFRSEITPDGKVLLLFNVVQPLNALQFLSFQERFQPTSETQAVQVVTLDTPDDAWAFPLHRQVAQDWLRQHMHDFTWRHSQQPGDVIRSSPGSSNVHLEENSSIPEGVTTVTRPSPKV